MGSGLGIQIQGSLLSRTTIRFSLPQTTQAEGGFFQEMCSLGFGKKCKKKKKKKQLLFWDMGLSCCIRLGRGGQPQHQQRCALGLWKHKAPLDGVRERQTGVSDPKHRSSPQQSQSLLLREYAWCHWWPLCNMQELCYLPKLFRVILLFSMLELVS